MQRIQRRLINNPDLHRKLICFFSIFRINFWRKNENAKVFTEIKDLGVIMDKLKLTGRALGRVFHFRSGCMQTFALTAQCTKTT
jgi:hypothetical protein